MVGAITPSRSAMMQAKKLYRAGATDPNGRASTWFELPYHLSHWSKGIRYAAHFGVFVRWPSLPVPTFRARLILAHLGQG